GRMSFWRHGGLRARLFLAHLLVILAGTATMLLVTFSAAPTLHDRLMVELLGPQHTTTNDPEMAAMEQATNAVFQAAMYQALLLSGGAATLVAMLVSLLISTRIATPIRQMLAASRRIAAGHYVERVPATGHDELAALAAEFNIMAAELEQVERRRVALIGDVAHELRTPLATIEGYTEGVLDGVVIPSDETWAMIHDEVGRLKRLVNDLQELSRAEAKQLVLHTSVVQPAELVEQARARLAPQFVEKDIELMTEVEANLPWLAVDSDRILQVLVNLLGNALRATPEHGTVHLRALADNGGVVFEVADTGIGIAPEHLPHLFERFYRVDKARSRTLGGHGIGLTISKALVEVHVGRIWASSDGAGRGATFRFFLPGASSLPGRTTKTV
ncbi:MAG TPA: ATP-binding protein, partial [Roseiflexaceae bacterium]|nr:ATP-binding protein [Roseiflexaceae bacterium]